jgi:lipopolysaccharide export system protein LptC
VVTADKAVQDTQNIHHAHLFNVEADMTAKDGAWYNMRAPRGYLDSQAEKLWLSGSLALFSDSGYELHTDAAFVDLAPACDAQGQPPPGKPGKPKPRCSAVTVRGNHEVTGQGPFGTMRADRFHIVKATKHMYLEGHVHMVLYPAHGAPKSKPAKKA